MSFERLHQAVVGSSAINNLGWHSKAIANPICCFFALH